MNRKRGRGGKRSQKENDKAGAPGGDSGAVEGSDHETSEKPE
jgi:hypothetical protein